MPKTVMMRLNPALSDWMLQRIDLNSVEEKDRERTQQYLEAKGELPLGKLRTMSKKWHIPFGYFLMSVPPDEELPILKYRSEKSETPAEHSRDLIDTIYNMQRIQTWMHGDRIANEYDELSVVGSLKGNESTVRAAEIIREDLGLKPEWFREKGDAYGLFRLMRQRVSEAGVLVMVNGIVGSNSYRVLNPGEFRAFALIDSYAPLIFINGQDSEHGKLFSLAHEVVHVWLGRPDVFVDLFSPNADVRSEERFCNAVAAELLVPQTLFAQFWKKESGTAAEKAEAATVYFRCSSVTAARRALDAGFVSQSFYQKVAQKAEECFWEFRRDRKEQESGGGDTYANQQFRYDHRFLEALRNSVAQGRTLERDAWELVHASGGAFKELMKRVFGGV